LCKIIKIRGGFPNEEAALKLLFLALRQAAKKWTMPIHHLAGSIEPLHDSVAGTDAGLGESFAMTTWNATTSMGRGRTPFPYTPSQKQNLAVYTKVLTHPTFSGSLACIRLSKCTIMVYHGEMAVGKRRSRKDVRRSVTLPPEVARQVDTIAKRRRLSDNRVLVELIEQGIEVRRQQERAFFELAERFRAASDPEQVRRLGDDLGRFVFGE